MGPLGGCASRPPPAGCRRRPCPTLVGFVAILEQGGGEVVALQQPVYLGAVASGQPCHFADLAARQLQQGDEVIAHEGRACLGQRLDVGGFVAQCPPDQRGQKKQKKTQNNTQHQDVVQLPDIARPVGRH